MEIITKKWHDGTFKAGYIRDREIDEVKMPPAFVMTGTGATPEEAKADHERRVRTGEVVLPKTDDDQYFNIWEPFGIDEKRGGVIADKVIEVYDFKDGENRVNMFANAKELLKYAASLTENEGLYALFCAGKMQGMRDKSEIDRRMTAKAISELLSRRIRGW